jgi:hypothetical protein
MAWFAWWTRLSLANRSSIAKLMKMFFNVVHFGHQVNLLRILKYYDLYRNIVYGDCR